MSEQITIRLAGKDYTVPQLTLGQLRDLSVGVTLPADDSDPQLSVRRSFERGVAVISAAILPSEKTLTPEALFAMPISRAELREATDAILKYAGLVPPRKTLEQLREELAALQAEIAAREAENGAAAQQEQPAGEAKAGAALTTH